MEQARTPAGAGSVVKASVVMLVLSILLSWIPLIGPFLAGLVGGRMAGSMGRAIVAALLPAVVLGVLVGTVLALFDLPLLGTVAGLGIAIWVGVQDLAVLAGAAVGGALTEKR